MKKMNNYVAPKAEVIELYMNKDLMRIGGSQVGGNSNVGGSSGSL